MSRRPMRLGELAERLGRDVEGDVEVRISGVAPLASAGPGDLVFVRSARYAADWARSAAAAGIVPPDVEAAGRPVIRSPRPDLDFARAVRWIVPAARPAPGVHPSAVVEAGARVDASAYVGPHAVVGAGCRIGPRSLVHAHAVLYRDVQLGADCTVHAGVVLREGTRLGDRVVLQPGVVIGGDGFGYTLDEEGRWEAVPQVGCVVIEDDVEIGANTTVDRATLGETRIRRGSKLDNLVQVAHNCDVGEQAIVVAQAGLAGSTVIGRRAVIMAQAGSAGHLSVGEGAFVGARAGLHKDVPAGARVYGAPQMEERRWHRAMSALARLPEALRRLRSLERRLAQAPPSSGERD